MLLKQLSYCLVTVIQLATPTGTQKLSSQGCKPCGTSRRIAMCDVSATGSKIKLIIIENEKK